MTNFIYIGKRDSSRMKRMRYTRKDFLALGAAASVGLLSSRGKPAAAHDAMPAGITNALEHQTYDMYQDWFSWLKGAGVPGYLGETNTPNSQKPWLASEVNKWLTLLDKAYQWLDAEGLAAVTAHTASPAGGGGDGLKVYGPDNPNLKLSARTLARVYEQASVIEKYPSTSTYLRGMNANGGEFLGGRAFSASSPGNYGHDYAYPKRQDYGFLQLRGHKLARLPLRWERVQTTIGGPLKSSELSRLWSSMDAAADAGIKIILDAHNYAGYYFSTWNYKNIGTSQLPISAFAELWGRLAQAAKDHPAIVGYDIMNEPQGLPGGPSQWEQASQAAVDAIRREDTQTRIWVPGYHERQGTFHGVSAFVLNHPRPWITGTNFGYTSHVYYGPGAGYYYTYDDVVAYWESKGY